MLSHVDKVRIRTPEERFEPDRQIGTFPGARVEELPVVQERHRTESAGAATVVDDGSLVLTKGPFARHDRSC